MLNLSTLQALVAQQDCRYPGWLTWEQRDNVIIAKPKFPLPDNAHKAILKVFRRVGGRFVSHNSEHYFEYVDKPTSSVSPMAKAYEQLQKEGFFVGGS